VHRVITSLVGSRLARFFLVALAGVLLDVLIFTLVVEVGIRPGIGSIISTSIAVLSTYFASSRLVFRVRYSPARMLAYVAWYVVSITGFSFAIEAAWTHFGAAPLVWKIVSLPFSFLINYAVVNYLVLRPARGDHESREGLS
jgi:putative flippase GtrA